MGRWRRAARDAKPGSGAVAVWCGAARSRLPISDCLWTAHFTIRFRARIYVTPQAIDDTLP